MKIYINRKPVNAAWGGGNMFVKAMYKHVPEMSPHELIAADNAMVAPDVMLLAGIDNDGYGISAEQAIMYKNMMEGKRVVKLFLRVNENDARKGTSTVDPMLITLSGYMDGAIFVSNWQRDYFLEKGWKCENNTVIVNGVDHELFKQQPKLNNGKINLLMSHWSDNYMKGQDYAEWLDEFIGKYTNEFTFTFIGRTKAQFKNSSYVRPLSGRLLANEIGKYDVCINASRFDPGPNSVIEPITCGLPTYVHKDGGGAVEFAGDDHVFSTFDELEHLLLKKKFSSNLTKFLTWNQTIQNYITYIESVCGKSIV